MLGRAVLDRLTLALFAAWCTLVLGAGASRAAAQTEPASDAVARAYERYLEADFAGAQGDVDAALADPSLTSRDLARAHALSAVLASLDRAREASVQSEIGIAVALDRDVVPPDGASRVVREAFDAARAREATDPAHIATTTSLAGAERTVEARAEDVPPALAGRVVLACGSGAARASAEGDTSASLVVGAAAAVCEAALRTAAGQRVLATTLDLARAEAEPAPHDDTVVWVVVGVALAVVIGAGIAIGVALSPTGDGGLGAPTVLEW